MALHYCYKQLLLTTKLNKTKMSIMELRKLLQILRCPEGICFFRSINSPGTSCKVPYLKILSKLLENMADACHVVGISILEVTQVS